MGGYRCGIKSSSTLPIRSSAIVAVLVLVFVLRRFNFVFVSRDSRRLLRDI